MHSTKRAFDEMPLTKGPFDELPLGNSPLVKVPRLVQLEIRRCVLEPISFVLLANDCNIHSATLFPVHLAVDNNYNDIVVSLLEKGANVNAVNELGQTPLHNVSKTGNFEIMKTLFNFGANGCLRDSDGKYPLHYACVAEYYHEESVESVELLLNRGADVDACTMENLTPLYLAAETGHSKVVELLLQHKPEIENECNQRSVYVALDGYDEESKQIFAALLEYGFSFDAEQALTYPKFFKNAVSGSHYKVVEILLKHGADVNMVDPDNGQTPLHYAAHCARDINVSKLLLSYGAQVNVKCSDKKTPLSFAVTENKADLVKLLLNNGANLNNAIALFHYAVGELSLDTAKAILEHDESLINLCDERGKSALHYSLERDDDEMFFYLMSKGADVNATTDDGWSCFHFAGLGYVTNGEVFKALLEKGANVHSKNSDGSTPLHVAVQSEELENIETLLQYGANVNAVDNKGRTAFHLAASNCGKDVITVLWAYGADLNMTTTRNKQTPLDCALSGENTDSFDDFSGDEQPWSSETAKVLIEFIIKLKSAGFYVSDRNLNSLQEACELRVFVEYEYGPRFDEEERKRFQISCEDEIARMKCHMVGNAAISFYDVLRLKTSPLLRVMLNQDIVHALMTEDYEKHFPVYARMIKVHVFKTIIRRQLLDKVIEIFHLVYSGLPKLNDYCTEEIFSYFSCMDMRKLIDAGKLAGFNRFHNSD